MKPFDPSGEHEGQLLITRIIPETKATILRDFFPFQAVFEHGVIIW